MCTLWSVIENFVVKLSTSSMFTGWCIKGIIVVKCIHALETHAQTDRQTHTHMCTHPHSHSNHSHLHTYYTTHSNNVNNSQWFARSCCPDEQPGDSWQWWGWCRKHPDECWPLPCYPGNQTSFGKTLQGKNIADGGHDTYHIQQTSQLTGKEDGRGLGGGLGVGGGVEPKGGRGEASNCHHCVIAIVCILLTICRGFSRGVL